jgi:hypothetical protein
VSVVIGGKLEEVIGWESKLVIGGDRRLILGPRWERNVGLKAETVNGDSEEVTLSSQQQFVPTINGRSNPSTKTEKCSKLEAESGKVVEQHKAKLKELRKKIKQNFAQATQHYDGVTANIKTYTADIGQLRQNVQTMICKFASLKTEAKKYQMKSDAFIKFMVQGTATLKAGDFKGSAKQKYHLVCDAIAELQGEVKWN